MSEAGRPVLVGTVSVDKSEMLGEMLKRRGIRARGPQRQVPREGIGDRRPGRPERRRSRSPRTWPAAAPTSSSAATRPASPRTCSTSGPEPGRGGQGDLRQRPWTRPGRSATRTTSGWSRPAASTSSAPSATTAGGSTTSSGAVPAARAIPARRASTCPSTTT